MLILKKIMSIFVPLFQKEKAVKGKGRNTENQRIP